MPGMKIVSEVKEADVTFLTDADVQFVSLVRHGANRSPFKVIKEEKEGGDGKMTMVIQSILVPKNSSLEDLAKKKDCAWAVEAKTDSKETFDTYDKYVQIEEDGFVQNSLQLTKLDGNGTFAMVGSLKDGKSKEVLTIPEQKMDIPISPMDTAIAEADGPAFVLTFRDMFDKELHGFLDVVQGTMNQSKVDTKKRKASVMSALTAFGNFLSIGIDAIDSNAKGGKKEEKDNAVGEAAASIIKAMEDSKKLNGGEDMTLFKTKEDFVSAVAEILDVREAKKLEDAKKVDLVDKDKTELNEDGTPKKKEEKKDAEFVSGTLQTYDKTPDLEVVQKVDKLTNDITALKTSFEEFGNRLQTSSGADTDIDDGLGNIDDGQKPGVFAGLFVNKEAKAA